MAAGERVHAVSPQEKHIVKSLKKEVTRLSESWTSSEETRKVAETE